MSDVSLSQLAADLSRLHLILSLTDGNPDDFNDPPFEAAVRRRLLGDRNHGRQLRQIATEVAILVAD